MKSIVFNKPLAKCYHLVHGNHYTRLALAPCRSHSCPEVETKTRHAACSPFPNESKRIEGEVIPRKSLKKGVLTLVTWAGAVYPAGWRPVAQLGLAFTRHAARVPSSGPPFFPFSSPTRIFGSHGYLRAGKGVRYLRVVRYLRGVWVPPRRGPARGAGPLGSHRQDFICLLQVLGEVPDLGKDRVELGQGYTKYIGGDVYA